jgi:regulator of sirC expression with transglutaminase-like and TPR domain
MIDIDRATFAAEVRRRGDDLDPVRANLLFAREVAYPELRPSEFLLQLDDLRDGAARAVTAHTGALNRGRALAEYLFGSLGFRGNHEDYQDPRNSYLNDVLARRLGLPISLSAVYVHVGRAVGLAVHGVGLPGHFVAAVAGDDGPLYLDAFNGGAVLTREDCARLVSQSTGHQGAFDRRWLAPTRPRDIVARMLHNLRNTYTEAEDWPHTAIVVERLRELQPDEPGHVRDLGMVRYKEGAFQHAAQYFGEYLAMAPDAADAADVRKSRDLLLDEISRLN